MYAFYLSLLFGFFKIQLNNGSVRVDLHRILCDVKYVYGCISATILSLTKLNLSNCALFEPILS